MSHQTDLDPSSFYLQGGPIGVLLIHGFTGAPPEMRLVGDYLHQQGLTVSGPLLPGHGTTVTDMNRRKWEEWTAHVERALIELRGRCKTAFVGGLSMGALLTLYLAAQHPDLPGAIVYSPPLRIADWRIYLTPLLKHLIPTWPKARADDDDLTDPQARSRLWSYDRHPISAAHELLKLILWVRRALPRIQCPLLIVESTLDHAIHAHSARYTYQRVGSTDKELVTLHNSGHCLTVDCEWEQVAERTCRFIQDRLV